MNNLKTQQVFNFENNSIRTILVNDELYFVGKDVAEILGYKNVSRDINRHVDEEDRQNYQNGTFESPRGLTIINESGLYSLILGSKLPKAKKFKRWVTSEVLPSIRKTGGYTNIPRTFQEALRLAADTEEERARMEQQIKLDAPYTIFGKTVSNSDGAISIGEFCKIVYEKHGISIGRNKMFSWLRKKGYLISYGREKNNPKQKYIEQGLFVSNPVIVARTQGNIQEATTLITGKGQVYFLEKLQEDSE
ncbi:BRO family protein [Enterococcus sp. AZ178]|uniref:BRO family protein n=1 Tax=unclassified Enterococcus TaxID=2608891 RepID=UPI003F6864F9